jgi:hypothetical protein
MLFLWRKIMKILKIIPIAFLALALLACSFTVNVPTVSTGVSQTLDISEPAVSNTGTNRISIEMGAGSLEIAGGASELIEGSIRYNVESWKPTITRSTDEITLSQLQNSNVGIPEGDIVNEWKLKLGTAPIDLTLSTGAYEGELDLGGLSITNLSISDGASKATVRFDSLNPVEMEQFSYKTGASNVELYGLGNANVKELYFDSGVGSYTLDFSGDVQHDISARVQTGMSDITIVIPEGVRARITVSGGLSNVDANGTWTISGNTYECGSEGPLITVNLDMAVGNLQLKQE